MLQWNLVFLPLLLFFNVFRVLFMNYVTIQLSILSFVRIAYSLGRIYSEHKIALISTSQFPSFRGVCFVLRFESLNHFLITNQERQKPE